LRAYEAHCGIVRERQKTFTRALTQPLAAALQARVDLQPYATANDEQIRRNMQSAPLHTVNVTALPYDKTQLEQALSTHTDTYRTALLLLINERDDRYFCDRHVLANMSDDERNTLATLRRSAHSILSLRIEIALHRLYFGDSRYADLVCKKKAVERAAAVLTKHIEDDLTWWMSMSAVHLDDEYEWNMQAPKASVHALRMRPYGTCGLPGCTSVDIHCAANCTRVVDIMGVPPVFCQWTTTDIHARVSTYVGRFLMAAAREQLDVNGVRRLVDPGPAPPPYRPPRVRAMNERDVHGRDWRQSR
jgi:hypothetical protein